VLKFPYEALNTCLMEKKMSSGEKSSSLESVRREIDALDDEILDLITKRFEVTGQVRNIKQTEQAPWPTPLRPTREATILRRLIARGKLGGLNPDLVVRLWRNILNESTSKQAPIILHVSRHLNANLAHRLRLRDHFGPMLVEEYRDEAQALMQIDTSAGDLCVVETEQPWVEAYLAGHAGKAQVIAALPALQEDAMPKLLVFGHAPVEATGHDETLVISEGKLPRDFAPQALWQTKAGAHTITSLPGFLMEHENPLIGLNRSNGSLKLKIAGRFASAALRTQ
jgi:chorismate mutase / prephenate dehydratase